MLSWFKIFHLTERTVPFSTKPLSSTLCREKTRLLGEYVACLNLHSADLNEYSKMIRERLTGDLLALIRKRMGKSRERTAAAHKRYIAHLREHRCDVPL